MSGAAREVRQLTGLRGLAALDVMLSHYGLWKIPALQPLVFNNAAVDLFFCLSSFTLCLVYGAGQTARLDLRGYYAARAGRIYPLYLAATVFTLAIGLIWREHAFAGADAVLLARQFAQQASMLGAWPIPALSGFWNPPAWSISAEVFCYVLVFPVLYAAARRGRTLPPGWLVAGLALAPLASVAMYLRHYDSTVNEIGFPPPADAWAYWTALTRAVTMAVAGWCAYLLWRQNGAVARLAGRFASLIALAFALVVALAPFGGWNSQCCVVLAPVLILGLMAPGTWVARLLAWRPVHGLGAISYAIYLLHWPVRDFARHVLGFAMHDDALRILVPMILTLLAAYASTRWFEHPARIAIRRMFGVRRRPAVG